MPKQTPGYQQLADEFYPYAKKTLGIQKDVKIEFLDDPKNALNPLGKTAYFDPDGQTISVYVTGRHSKDVLRSLSHELCHARQHEQGRIPDDVETSEGYAQKDKTLRNLEKEAYLKGNMIFRDWEDTRKQKMEEKPIKEAFSTTTGLTDAETEWLTQMVQMEAEALDFDNWRDASITEATIVEYNKYKTKLREILEHLLGPELALQLMEEGNAPYAVLMTLRGEGVGIWDGRWEQWIGAISQKWKSLKNFSSSLKHYLGSFADSTGTGTLNLAFSESAFDSMAQGIQEQYFGDEPAEIRMRNIEEKKKHKHMSDREIKYHPHYQARLQAQGKLEENKKDNKWIQKAINPEHKGYCTPMTKKTCTPKRKALAKTLKTMNKEELLRETIRRLVVETKRQLKEDFRPWWQNASEGDPDISVDRYLDNREQEDFLPGDELDTMGLKDKASPCLDDMGEPCQPGEPCTDTDGNPCEGEEEIDQFAPEAEPMYEALSKRRGNLNEALNRAWKIKEKK